MLVGRMYAEETLLALAAQLEAARPFWGTDGHPSGEAPGRAYASGGRVVRMALRRTTVELDEDLLTRAQEVLGTTTMRSTLEEAMRRLVVQADEEFQERRRRQLEWLERFPEGLDMDVYASDEMWR